MTFFVLDSVSPGPMETNKQKICKLKLLVFFQTFIGGLLFRQKSVTGNVQLGLENALPLDLLPGPAGPLGSACNS